MSLASGWHAYVWPSSGWAKLDLPKVAADCNAMGFGGVVLHSGLYVAREVAIGHLDRPFVDAGLSVAYGLGFPKPRAGLNTTIARCIEAALDVPGTPVCLDWEGSWDGHSDDARQIVDTVLADRPDAPARITHALWWAPVKLPNGHGTHPSAPTNQFLRLTAPDVPLAPQCYNDGHRDGETAWQIKWSRTCYAPRAVHPSIQAYAHSVADRVSLLCAEPDLLAWDYVEFDGEFRLAMRAAVKLKSLGLSGPDAVRVFQRSHGLVEDGTCGPKTLAALGL